MASVVTKVDKNGAKPHLNCLVSSSLKSGICQLILASLLGLCDDLVLEIETLSICMLSLQ